MKKASKAALPDRLWYDPAKEGKPQWLPSDAVLRDFSRNELDDEFRRKKEDAEWREAVGEEAVAQVQARDRPKRGRAPGGIPRAATIANERLAASSSSHRQRGGQILRGGSEK